MAKKSKTTIYNFQSYKKELKLAFGIDVIVDYIEIHPLLFCKACKPKYGESVKRFQSEKASIFQKCGHAL